MNFPSSPGSERELQALLASISPSFARVLPENLALEFTALACEERNGTLAIAIADVPSEAAQTRIERATGMQVRMHVVPAHLLAPEIARCYGTLHVRHVAMGDVQEASLADFIDRLLERAVLERASDVHIDGLRERARVRFRVDGKLKVVDTLEPAFAVRLISRLKLLSGMDISERRLPQDGRLTFPFESRLIDIRLASITAESGERLALRIFDRDAGNFGIDDLAFSPRIAAALKTSLRTSSGFFLVCGPTGSGKSTTLYAIVRELYSDARHICTVEDPVEKNIEGITQVAVHVKLGLTFAHALRALLRQDPDVVMIGEIRDTDTAATAFGAALSGQLVLSTVHGADIARGIDRLCELGLERVSLTHAISGMMTQRLVRRLCVHCRVRDTVSAHACRRFGFAAAAEVFRADGCERCGGSGYRGRIVLADIVTFHAAQTLEDRHAAFTSRTLANVLEDARERCLQGDTSIAEIDEVFAEGCEVAVCSAT